MNAFQEVAKQTHNTGPQHWKVGLRVLEYLNATRSLGARFSTKGAEELVAFADATSSSCKEEHRSVSGAIIEFAGGAELWLFRS